MKGMSYGELFSLIKSHIFAVLLFILVAVLMVNGFANTADKRDGQAIRSASDSIRRAVVTCYAIEGSFPDSYEYIRDNYGVFIDEDKYVVFYTVFASNIPPNFKVVEKR
ncbi:MAG: hypothetical protein FWE66_00630 [Oscillospiraceae bacterium]|nr:hypothetical protein [Oscillospiraceae bacterium]